MITEKVTWVHHWSDRTFSFRTTRSSGFRFNTGEFAMIGLNVDGRNILRAYSVASPPWADYLEFLSIKVQDGPLTSRLQHVQPGDDIVINEKTSGTLRNEALVKGGELWLLATGTGLAPFMSVIQDVESLETWSRIHVVHSVRDRKDLAYTQELSTAFAGHDLHEMIAPVLDYRPLVTGEGDPRITAILGTDRLPIDPARDAVMICGNLQFNFDMSDWCKAQGMTEGTMRDPGSFVLEKSFVEK